MKAVFGILFVSVIGISSATGDEIESANNEFTVDMYNSLAKKEQGNIFFSPISVHSVLSMLYQGAGGSTKDAFSKALHVSSPSSIADEYEQLMEKLNNVEGVTLSLANKIYVSEDYVVENTVQETLIHKFHSEIKALDFIRGAETTSEVNSWVKEETHDKISELFQGSDFDSSTRMVLVNAIYFKGDWAYKFNTDETSKQQFHVDSEKTVEVDMMSDARRVPFKHCSEWDAQMIELPYKNQDFSMIVILPDKQDGVANLEAKLHGADLSELTEGLSEERVIVSMPKFKIETSMDLQDVLEDIGLGELFGTADLKGLSANGESISVSKAIQKAFIEVNEEGSEAAAATGVVVNLIAPSLGPKYFTVDHPFFIVLKAANNILFFGKVTEPTY